MASDKENYDREIKKLNREKSEFENKIAEMNLHRERSMKKLNAAEEECKRWEWIYSHNYNEISLNILLFFGEFCD